MKVDWTGVKTAIERGLKSAGNDDRRAMAMHCRAGHRMASRGKGPVTKQIVDELHRASRSIDVDAAVKHMQVAMEKVESQMSAA